LGLGASADYANLSRIMEEIDYADKIIEENRLLYDRHHFQSGRGNSQYHTAKNKSRGVM